MSNSAGPLFLALQGPYYRQFTAHMFVTTRPLFLQLQAHIYASVMQEFLSLQSPYFSHRPRHLILPLHSLYFFICRSPRFATVKPVFLLLQVPYFCHCRDHIANIARPVFILLLGLFFRLRRTLLFLLKGRYFYSCRARDLASASISTSAEHCCTCFTPVQDLPF